MCGGGLRKWGRPRGRRIRRRSRDGRRPGAAARSPPRRHDRKRGEQPRTRLCHGTYIGPLTAGHARFEPRGDLGVLGLGVGEGGMGSGEARRTGPSRREMMALAGASALTLTAGAALSQAQGPAIASGSVFEDRDRSGKARARQSRHRRGDGVGRPRRGPNRRGGTVAAAGE